MFKRRLGENRPPQCQLGHSCPQILELNNGDFAVVGTDITEEAIPAMLPGLGVGPKERVVRVPRGVVVAARPEMPVA